MSKQEHTTVNRELVRYLLDSDRPAAVELANLWAESAPERTQGGLWQVPTMGRHQWTGCASC